MFSFSLKNLKLQFNLFFVLVKKTFLFDLFSIWKLIFSIIFIIIIPLFLIFFVPQVFFTNSTSINELLGILQIVFSYLVALASIMIYSSASLIADEVKSNTIILLATKPILKATIFWGKYCAILLYGVLLSVASLCTLCLFAFIHPFTDIGSYFVSQFFFSLIIIFFYSTFTIGFSMIFKNVKTATLIPLTISLITIFLFFMIRPALMNPTPSGGTYYELYQIYYFDLGYHFMNIYTWFYETFISILPLSMIRWLVSWGLYSTGYDPLSPEIEIYTKTNYIPPQASLFIILLFGIIISMIGFFIFRRRDIT
jgi:ABC-type transport system involved in multi-copper enzyme maturation permease subunit